MSDVGFGPKLAIVLKALTISNGRLAADLAVDKSLIGRWVSGSVKPSMHNLSRLTIHVAGRIPGFSLLDWEREPGELTALVAAGESASSGDVGDPALALPVMLAASRARGLENVRREGHPYPGVYVGFRPAFRKPDDVDGSLVVIWLESGRLVCRHLDKIFRNIGEIVMLDRELYFTLEDPVRTDRLGLAVLTGVAGRKAMRLDGLVMTAHADRIHRPIIAPWVLQRLDDLPAPDQPPPEADLNVLCERLNAVTMAGDMKAMAGETIATAIAPNQVPTSRSLSICDIGWTPALEADIRRVRKAILGVDTCFPVFGA